MDTEETDVVGPRATVTRLFDEHAHEIEAYVFRRSGSREVAQDVCATTFEHVARALLLREVAPETVTGGWLMHIAKCRLIDHWRRIGRRRSREHGGDVVDLLEPTRLDETTVGIALSDLRQRDRSLLIERYVIGRSVGEIARGRAQTYRAVESALARARRRLKVAYLAVEVDGDWAGWEPSDRFTSTTTTRTSRASAAPGPRRR